MVKEEKDNKKIILAFVMVEVFIAVVDTDVEFSIVVDDTALDGKVFVKHILNSHFLIVK